jgi:N-acetylmuramoyl-L-alanine amidase
MLRVCGYRVALTREEDVSTADPSAGNTTRKKKVSDMHNRLKLMQSHNNAVFISVHQNKFQQSKYSGAQVFYSPNHPGSQILAQGIQDSFRTLLQPENKREIKKAGSELFLLYNAKQPAVLVECGFLSNPQECRMLTQQEYQRQVALAVLSAASGYLSPTADSGEV